MQPEKTGRAYWSVRLLNQGCGKEVKMLNLKGKGNMVSSSDGLDDIS